MSPFRPSILIVDDLPANLVALEKVLAPMAATVVKAHSGNEALAACIDQDFAAVLLDIDMPGMDGYEVAAFLRGEARTARLPILFVTASYRDEAHELQGYGAGAVDYIEKPISDFILRSKVQVFLDLYNSRRRLEEELARSEAMRSELIESEERLRHAVIDAPIPVLMHAEDGEILLISRRLSEATGLAAPEIPTLAAWVDRAFGPRAAEVRTRVASLFGIPAAQPIGEYEVRTGDGRVLTWDFHIGPLPPLPDGRRVLISMALDVTETRRARDALERSVLDLARSNAELETFAYVASHDLREPLRMVTMYLSLLERRLGETLDDEGREFIDFARDGAVRMDRLILDLLEYSRVGRVDRPAQDLDLDEVLAAVTHTLGTLIDETGAEITVPQPLPKVHCNFSEVTRLFQNVLANALKYRRPGAPPRITITSEPEGGFQRFCVADNGIGIDRQYFQRIFGIFQRLHTREQYDGTGIGLAVCKKTVEHYGGRIWVDSEEGVGSRFFFTLPG